MKRMQITYSMTLPESEFCVGLVTFKGCVILATNKGVYRLDDADRISGSSLKPIPFAVEELTDVPVRQCTERRNPREQRTDTESQKYCLGSHRRRQRRGKL